jgi:hypothetical protein
MNQIIAGFRCAPLIWSKKGWSISPVFLLLFTLLTFVTPAHALIITPVWDTTITSDPGAATIEGTITSAIQFYEARFADPLTISIQFQEMPGGLGESQYSFYPIPYTQFLVALQLDATTTNDTYALEFLPAGPDNPVTGDLNINVHTATLKALGLTGFDAGFTNGVEGFVYLNTSIMNLSRTNIDPSKFDLLAVAEHEMDEVLGLGSDLPFTDDPFPQDLFRYATNGTRSFTTSGDDAYFSLDGANFMVQFNQESDGDYGDWWSHGVHTPRVQDAFSNPGATPNPNVELIGLDVMGFDLVPPPQPGIASISLSRTNLVLTGTNGLATGVYHLLTSTNLALPLSQWSSVATNSLFTNGNFTFTATNAVKPRDPCQFYILQLQ